MRNSFTSDDHDPGDEDPTECVKRALLEVLEDDDHSAPACRRKFDDLVARGLPPFVAELVTFPDSPPEHVSILDVPWSSSPWPWLV